MDVRQLIEAIAAARAELLRELSLMADGYREIIHVPVPPKVVPPASRSNYREHTDEVLRVIAASGEDGLLMEEISQAVLGRCDQDTNVSLFLSVVQPLKNDGQVEVCNVRCYRIRS